MEIVQKQEKELKSSTGQQLSGLEQNFLKLSKDVASLLDSQFEAKTSVEEALG